VTFKLNEPWLNAESCCNTTLPERKNARSQDRNTQGMDFTAVNLSEVLLCCAQQIFVWFSSYEAMSSGSKNAKLLPRSVTLIHGASSYFSGLEMQEDMKPPTKKITRVFVARIPPSVTDEMFRR
jgi:hypothetical protein